MGGGSGSNEGGGGGGGCRGGGRIGRSGGSAGCGAIGLDGSAGGGEPESHRLSSFAYRVGLSKCIDENRTTIVASWNRRTKQTAAEKSKRGRNLSGCNSVPIVSSPSKRGKTDSASVVSSNPPEGKLNGELSIAAARNGLAASGDSLMLPYLASAFIAWPR